MSDQNLLVAAVDAFINEPKRLLAVQGMDDWRRIPNSSGRGLEYRIKWPIEMRGSSAAGMSLVIVGHPNDEPQTWSFVLLFNDVRVSGLDIEADDNRHINPVVEPSMAQRVPYAVQGSNWHSWWDNRHLATKAGLPHKLSIAQPVPPGLQRPGSNRFQRSLYWFCEEVNIEAPQVHLDIPIRSSLL